MSLQIIPLDLDISQHDLSTPGAIIPGPDSQDDHQDREIPATSSHNRLRRLLECGEYPWPLSLDVFEHSRKTSPSGSRDDDTNSNADQDTVIQDPPRLIDPFHHTNGSTWPLDMPHHVFAGRPEPPDALVIRRPVATRPLRPTSANSLTRQNPAFNHRRSEIGISGSMPLSWQQMPHQLALIEPSMSDLFRLAFQPIPTNGMINYVDYFGISQPVQQIDETSHGLAPICPPNVQDSGVSFSSRSNRRRQRPVRFEQTFGYHNGR